MRKGACKEKKSCGFMGLCMNERAMGVLAVIFAFKAKLQDIFHHGP